MATMMSNSVQSESYWTKWEGKGWARHLTEDGRVYYFHSGTGASQWHLPNELYKSRFLLPQSEDFSEETQVVFPCEAKAILGVSCVTEVLPQGAMVGEAQQRVEAMIEMLKQDINNIEEITPLLPDWLNQVFVDPGFFAECYDKFAMLDSDGSGRIEAEELYPVVMELTQEHPLSVTLDHCRRLMDIFDADRNGVLNRDEFVLFVKFLLTISFLEQSAIN